MILNLLFKMNKIIAIGLVIFAAMFLWGCLSYNGSAGYYIVFSICYLVLFFSAFYKIDSYSYPFLAVTLCLGFWVKCTLHLMLNYTYREPVGYFNYNSNIYDHVLLVSTTAALGVIGARLIYCHIFNRQNKKIDYQLMKLTVPMWYIYTSSYIWVGIFVLTTTCALINFNFGIQQIGLVSKTIWPWPLNALIYLMLVAVLPVVSAGLLWWDFLIGGRKIYRIYLFIGLEWLSSVSILSRGLFLFSVFPILIALYMNRKYFCISAKKILYIALCYCMAFVVCSFLVSSLRNNYYLDSKDGVDSYYVDSKTSVNSNYNHFMAKFNSFSKVDRENQVTAILTLPVERWVGIEGVMSVVSYPNKNIKLLIDGLMEHAEIGKFGIYQNICQSQYRFVNAEKFKFSALPGIIGFLFYSNSLLMVLFGMMLIVFLMLSVERGVRVFARNPLLCAFYGIMLSNLISQFGGVPREIMIYLGALSVLLIVIAYVQSRYFFVNKYNI